MATRIAMPEAMSEQVLTWAAESYMPPLAYWLGQMSKSEQEWYDTLALLRFDLETTHPREWP